MKTYIYILRCPFSGEVKYVGKTLNVKARWSQHKCDKRGKICKLKSWIKSIVNKGSLPVLFVIDECDGEYWRYLESFYMKTFRDMGCDLKNMIDGGLGRSFVPKEMREHLSLINKGKRGHYINPKRKPVTQYSLNGEPIKSFDSLLAAEKETGATVGNLLRAIRIKRTAKGFQWRYENLPHIEKYTPPIVDNSAGAKSNEQPVSEIDKNGNTIKTFKTMKEAINQTGIKNISKVCRGLRNHAGGRYFKYVDADSLK